MSIAVMTEVWKDAPVAGTELLLLLALADSANDDRECWPSLRHLQHKVRVSRPQLQKLITKLVNEGLIEKILKGGKGTKGRESNLYRILNMTGIAQDTCEVSQGIPVDAETGITQDTLNHHSESSIETVASDEAGDSANAKSKKTREPNPMYDAIKEIWGYTASMNGAMARMLTGIATQKGWKEYNLETPITPDGLRLWAKWYRETALKGDESLNMLEERIKIQSSITQWQETHQTVGEDGEVRTASYVIGSDDDPFKDEIID